MGDFLEVLASEGQTDLGSLLGCQLDLLVALAHLHVLRGLCRQGVRGLPLVLVLIGDVDDLLPLLLHLGYCSLGDVGHLLAHVLHDVPDSRFCFTRGVFVSFLVFGEVGAVSEPLSTLLTQVGLVTSVTAEMFS